MRVYMRIHGVKHNALPSRMTLLVAARTGDVALFGRVLQAVPTAVRDSLCERAMMCDVM